MHQKRVSTSEICTYNPSMELYLPIPKVCVHSFNHLLDGLTLSIDARLAIVRWQCGSENSTNEMDKTYTKCGTVL